MEGERRSSYFFVGVLAAVVARDSKELTETTCKRLEGAALNGRRSFSPPPVPFPPLPRRPSARLRRLRPQPMERQCARGLRL